MIKENLSIKSSNPFLFLKFFFLTFILLGGNACQKSQPNVLLISLDASRARNFSSYGHYRQTSPFIDKIAGEGIRFSNAFVNTHGTTPSHTTILTSLYQETHRVEFRGKANRPSKDKVPPTAIMLQEILKKNDYVTLSVNDGAQLSRQYGFDRGFVEYDDNGNGVKAGTEKMVRLVRKHISGDRPIFAFYHTYEIHSPYFPPRKYLKMFGDFKSAFVPSSKNLLRSISSAKQDLNDQDLDFLRASYDGGIRFTDDILKNMFKELDELGFFKNYLLIITSDHGEELAEHGGFLHRGLLYDELLHVPLILAGNGLSKGKVDHRMVSSVDIAPTILSHLNISPLPVMEGKNLLARSTDTDDMEMAVFSQYGRRRYSIRTHRWKLIENIRPHQFELYDFEQDPWEQTNLALNKPEEVARLTSRLQKWRKTRKVLKRENVEKVQLTKEQLKRLKSLGYVTGD